MKTKTILFLFCITMLAGACSRRESAELPSDLAERATLTGREVSGAFMVTLKGSLLEAIEEGGPVAAIRVCHEDAGGITVSAAQRAGVLDLRRTSLRLRNPENKPTGLDEIAWGRLNDPDSDVRQEVEDWVTIDPDDDDRVVYYRALRTIRLCTTCHGSADQIPSDVLAALAEHYPDDRAVGFEEGDLRGLLRVDLARKILEESL